MSEAAPNPWDPDYNLFYGQVVADADIEDIRHRETRFTVYHELCPNPGDASQEAFKFVIIFGPHPNRHESKYSLDTQRKSIVRFLSGLVHNKPVFVGANYSVLTHAGLGKSTMSMSLLFLMPSGHRIYFTYETRTCGRTLQDATIPAAMFDFYENIVNPLRGFPIGDPNKLYREVHFPTPLTGQYQIVNFVRNDIVDIPQTRVGDDEYKILFAQHLTRTVDGRGYQYEGYQMVLRGEEYRLYVCPRIIATNVFRDSEEDRRQRQMTLFGAVATPRA